MVKRKSVEAMTAKTRAFVSRLVTPEAIALVPSLFFDTALGLRAKKGSLVEQCASFKNAHLDYITLLRVGEMYQAFGVDALLLSEHTFASLKGGKELCVIVNTSRLRALIKEALDVDLTLAIYEESAVICTPRQRYLAQVVSRAAPQYVVDHDDEATISARPYGGVAEFATGCQVCVVDIPERICRTTVVADRSTALAMLSVAMEPVYVFRTAADWLVDIESETVSGECLVDAVLSRVSVIHFLKVDQFRTVTAEFGCAPLSHFTSVQLGLQHEASFDVRSLALSALPRGADATVRQHMRRWLMTPPSRARATVYQQTLSRLTKSKSRRLWPAPPGRRLRTIMDGCANAAVVTRLGMNARALMAESHDELQQITLCEFGLPRVEVRCDEIVRVVDATFDGDAVCARRVDVETTALRAFRAHLEAVLEPYDPGEVARDTKTTDVIGLRGAVRDDRQPVLDTCGRPIPGVYATVALSNACKAVRHARETLQARENEVLVECIRDLQRLSTSICVIEQMALDLATLSEHARIAHQRLWCMAADGPAFEATGAQPYWLDNPIANTVRVERGVVILTAPNGGGKTTLLRTIASIALLHQCGLFVPAQTATVPEYTAIFLRSGANDSQVARMSSFACEMRDMSVVMRTDGCLALIDEPCRGTSTQEGLALLTAIVDELSPTISVVFSTHFHELRPTRHIVDLQLGARVCGVQCVPDYTLRPGRCRRSHALHLAIAVGLPIEVVRAAKLDDDVETVIAYVLGRHNLEFLHLAHDEHPPMSWTSLVYVLLTVDGAYVGETDRFKERLLAHRQQKPHFDTYFVAHLPDKSRARAMESCIIRDLAHEGLSMLSTYDAVHGVC